MIKAIIYKQNTFPYVVCMFAGQLKRNDQLHGTVVQIGELAVLMTFRAFQTDSLQLLTRLNGVRKQVAVKQWAGGCHLRLHQIPMRLLQLAN